MTVHLRTLVLHPDFSPINLFPPYTIKCQDAITRVIQGNAICVATHRQVETPLHSNLYWPSVIVNRANYKRRSEALLKRDTLFYRDHGVCAYCEKQLTLSTITCDHVMPASKGGPLVWENVVAACKGCNAAKDNHLPVGKWKPKIKPYKPSMYELIDKRRDFPIVVDNINWMDYIGTWRAEVFERGQKGIPNVAFS